MKIRTLLACLLVASFFQSPSIVCAATQSNFPAKVRVLEPLPNDASRREGGATQDTALAQIPVTLYVDHGGSVEEPSAIRLSVPFSALNKAIRSAAADSATFSRGLADGELKAILLLLPESPSPAQREP